MHRPHSYLVAHSDTALTAEQDAEYQALLARAAQLEPIPYLIGTAPFYGLDFIVSPAVLIPRPETELLVERILRWAEGREHLVIADVGTGSGCIAITLARHLPAAEVFAVDLSGSALAVAERNAAAFAPGRVRFLAGDLLVPVPAGIDVVAANLPYIADDEWTSVSDGVKWYEPVLALRGGVDGLDHFRSLLPAAASKLNRGGLVVLEIGWKQGLAVRRLAREYFPRAEITIVPDFAGHDRIVAIEAARA